jgi:hypothetical protein
VIVQAQDIRQDIGVAENGKFGNVENFPYI